MQIRTISRRTALLAAASAAAFVRAPPAAAAVEGALADAVARAGRLERLQSLVVAAGGEVRVARSFRGGGADRPVNVKSLSKTVLALMTGIAIDKGVLPGAEATLGAVMPGLIPKAADPRVRDIRIADLLTMRAGLARTSGPNYGRWVQSADWLEYALVQPMVAEPGGPMLYSTGSYHILGAALAEAAGRDLRRLGQDWLGDPLEFEVPPWTRDPQGRFMGGNNMALSPTALLRIGEAVRQGGTWRGRRIVGRDWIEASWTARTVSPWSGDAYGYGWFLRERDGRRFAYGRGYGGQLLYVAPDLDLTVVLISDPTRPARSGGYIDVLHDLVTEAIVPAVAQG